MSVREEIKANYEEVLKSMKKAAFWKGAVFGIVCVKQEFEVYEKLAKDRLFDMSKFLKKTVDRFWKAAATGYSMDEQYILAVEESFFDPTNEWDELALQIVQDIYDLFYAISEKDSPKALKMQERQIALIEKYSSLAKIEHNKGSELIEKALAYHLNLTMEIAAVPNKEKKAFLERLSERELYGILEDDFMSFCPVTKKEKPAKKKLPEIRRTSLDFDKERKETRYAWLLNSTPKQWVLGENPDMNDGKGAYSQNYYNKDYLDLCYKMDVCYRLYAADDYVCNQIPERARGFWYLSAFSLLKAYQLWEKGYPVNHANTRHYLESHQNGKEGFQPIFRSMIYAYASGEDTLLSELQHFSSEKEQEKTSTLLKILAGEDDEAIYTCVESWDDGEVKQGFLAILKEDKKEIRKAVLQIIRHDRKMYDMNRTMIDPYAYTFLKLAKERGIEVEPVVAAEVLEGNLEMVPLDKNYWKLPYQDEIDEWLKNH